MSGHGSEVDAWAWIEEKLPADSFPEWVAPRRHGTASAILFGQAGTGSMTGTTPGNTAVIPVGLLSVRKTGTDPFRALSADTPLVVHEQDRPSATDGDAVSYDYRVEIPSVPADTYSVTLDYIVSAQ
jgi:hypothetical protein